MICPFSYAPGHKTSTIKHVGSACSWREKNFQPATPDVRHECSVDLNELGLEDECRVGGDNAADSAVAIRKMRRNRQLALLADFHAQEALVPALNDLALTNRETERLAAVIAGVKLVAVGEGALVVNLDGVACRERNWLAHSSSSTESV